MVATTPTGQPPSERSHRWLPAWLSSERIVDAVRLSLKRPTPRSQLDPRAWFEFGKLLRELHRDDEANTAFQRALSLRAEGPGGWADHSEILRSLGRREEALAAALRDAGLDRETARADSWIQYGRCLLEFAERPGANDDARRAFKRAGEIEPGSADAAAASGDALAAAGKLDEALSAYERALEAAPSRPEFWAGKENLLRELGRSEEADDARYQWRRIAFGGTAPATCPESPLAALARLIRITFVRTDRTRWLLFGSFYALGLLVWWLNAALRDPGPDVGRDLRYLVAGVVPAAIIATGFAAAYVWSKTAAWTRYHLLRRREGVARWISLTGAGLLVSGPLVFGLAGLTDLMFDVPDVTGFAVAGMTIGALMVVAARGDPLFEWIWLAVGAWIALTLIAVGFLTYSLEVYPRLPQALGGGAPRCAMLDIDATALAPATVAELGGRTEAARRIARTAPVDIVFTRGDTLLVRSRGHGDLHELRGTVVHAVIDCG